jgi:hypothetical protein
MQTENIVTIEQVSSFRPIFSIVPRDLEILNTIRRLAPISRTQLQRLHFPCELPIHHLYCDCGRRRGYGAVCRRLKRLRDDAELITGYRLSRFRTARQGMIYMLSPKYEWQVAMYESEPATASEKRKLDRALKGRQKMCQAMIFGRDLTLKHHLFVNDLYIWWELSRKAALNDIPDLYIRPMIHDGIKALKLEAPVPDAIFSVRIHGKIYQFYVEADRGTERIPRLRTKLFDYIKVLRTSPNIFVLFVFHKAERLKTDIVSIVTEVEKDIDRSGTYLTRTKISDRVWFSVYDQTHDLDRQPFIYSNVLLDPIWVTWNAKEKAISAKFSLRRKLEFRISNTG